MGCVTDHRATVTLQNPSCELPTVRAAMQVPVTTNTVLPPVRPEAVCEGLMVGGAYR